MKTFTTKCPLTGIEKNYNHLTETVVYDSFENNFGHVVQFFKTEGDQVKIIGSMVAEENVNDLEEIIEELKFLGLSKDLSDQVNNIFNSLIS